MNHNKNNLTFAYSYISYRTMKTSVLIIATVLGLSHISFGQETRRVHTEEPSRILLPKSKESKNTQYKQMYFTKEEQLKKYFKSGKVENYFPAYNYAVSKGENQKVIREWLAKEENKKTLTKEGLQAITLYLKQK